MDSCLIYTFFNNLSKVCFNLKEPHLWFPPGTVVVSWLGAADSHFSPASLSHVGSSLFVNEFFFQELLESCNEIVSSDSLFLIMDC